MPEIENKQPEGTDAERVIPDGMGLITVLTGFPGREVAEAFVGRWLIEPSDDQDEAVALTARSRIAVYSQHFHMKDGEVVPSMLADFDDLDDAEEFTSCETLSMAARAMGQERTVFRDI